MLHHMNWRTFSEFRNPFNKVVRVLVATMYDVYVSLSVTEQQWMEELTVFIENDGFPCVGAWDGFHVYLNSKLKKTILALKSVIPEQT